MKLKLCYLLMLLMIGLMVGCSSSSDDDGDSAQEVLNQHFPKRVQVFGLNVQAQDEVSDNTLLHVASVLAEYLDSDEDGTVNDTAVLAHLRSLNASMIVGVDDSSLQSFFQSIDGINHSSLHFQDVRQNEIVPSNGVNSRFDAALEEVLHYVTHFGYSQVYPNQLGERVGSQIALAMDSARGDHFESIPSSYPAGAWYTYTDTTCEYGCQITEYTYWLITSILGAQDFPGRLAQISQEWHLNTSADVRSTDNVGFEIVTSPNLNLPTALPNGHYDGATFTIEQL